MNLTMTHFIWILIIVALSFVPGWYAARKIKSADDYSVGGRSSGTWVVAGTILGTIIGGAATVGTAQSAFRYGLSGWMFTFSCAFGLLFLGIFYASPLRKSGLTTISAYLVQNFGPKAGPLVSIAASLGIFFSIVGTGLTILFLLQGIFHLNNFFTCVIIVFIVMAYVFFGGLGGSSLTGLFKMAILMITLLAAGFGAYSAIGGLEGMHRIFPDKPWFSLAGNGMEAFLYSLFASIVGVISTQTYCQAIFSAKDTKTASKACFLAAAITLPVGLPSVVIGMFMKHMHPTINPIDALPLYFVNYLPDWLGGIAIAGLILSGMGNIAGLALGCATMISRDIFGDMLGIKDSGRLLFINRISVLGITIASMLFVVSHLDSLVLTWKFLSFALRGAGIFLPFTFCILFPGRMSHGWGIAAIVAGIVVSMGWPYVFPGAKQVLLQGLVANLLFLIPAVIFGPGKKSGD